MAPIESLLPVHPGEVIRLARIARGVTQAELGQACGYSQSAISRIEKGGAGAYDVRVLAPLAAELDISRQLVGLSPIRPKGRASMNRREFLTGAAAGLAVALVPRSVARGRAAGGAGLAQAAAVSPTGADLDQRVGYAHVAYQRGDYEWVAEALAGLLADTSAGMPDESDRELVLGAQVWAYVLAAKLTTKLGLYHDAKAAADRAITLAAYAPSPVLKGAASYQLASAANAVGDAKHAEEVAVVAADQLGRGPQGPAVVSVRGALLLIAAVAASTDGDITASGRHLADAQVLAEELGADANHAWTGFGPTNVATHRLAVALQLDRPDKAVELGVRIVPERFPTALVGRRCQVHLDTAIAHGRLGDDAAAADHLMQVRKIGPQVLRYNTDAHALIEDLLHRERRSATPGLRSLARYVELPGR